MIVIGLGTGRSGTASLAHLLNSQTNSMCFHELNPSCMRFTGTVQPALNTIYEFQNIIKGGETSHLTVDLSREISLAPYDKLCQMDKVELIGDIAMYYLTYVEDILKLNPTVKFVCLKRDKNETVKSWLNKTQIKRWRSKKLADYFYSIISRTPYFEEYNYWEENDCLSIKKDPIWDKCFPKFTASNKEEAIRMYWEYYYNEAEQLAQQYSQNFKIFDISLLNNNEGQSEVLSFCGLNKDRQIFTKAHLHSFPR